MNGSDLFSKYGEIEGKLYPIMDFLNEKKDDVKYKGLYKGFMTLQCPFVYQPDILFLGINPGGGAYFVFNGQKPKPNTNNIPIRMKREFIEKERKNIDKNEDIPFDMFKSGNAYIQYEYPKKKGKWICDYEWYQRNKPINNQFVANFIDLLYAIADEKGIGDKTSANNAEPSWYQSFGKNIMYANLYPIATDSTAQLRKIFNQLAKEEALQQYWNEVKDANKPINEWIVRKYFKARLLETIELVQPRIIVCMGNQAYYDLMSTEQRTGKRIFMSTRTLETDRVIPIIGFSRSGNWQSLIPKLAAKIVESDLHLK